MNAHRIAVLLVPILLAAPVDLLGQEPAIVEGSHVRVTAPSISDHAFEGTVVALKPDTVTVEADVWQRGGWESGRWEVPLSAMTRLELSRKRGTKAGTGALLGGVIGAVPGLIGAMAVLADNDEGFVQFGPEVLLTPVLTGAIGAGIGAIIGAMAPNNQWVSVPLYDFQASLGTFGDGVTFSISVRH
ncbi:MAG: hypothetical protein GWN99_13570 [Gemmatimonadetes bacterium]|uniref:Uncharacterized protein n=1 Tax=Candidatus Kutchimonas denitrificans TaxID=3056748 RepID=A0AAE5CDJ8_9BACT|nr:hypothetical protein [Gemmatimonadota bacterium]NIR75914.1 hypothetical protein [Candidatus Kutchimonas denitrificans]NIS02075.1 hypothetical protein [Gemmatimonadota bacterium]NIT67881.1 hypothetical protein [Gemmatimonadota bacterium]NIU53860.1 hypothetical protein [Gemmatimonadota bacterium]